MIKNLSGLSIARMGKNKSILYIHIGFPLFVDDSVCFEMHSAHVYRIHSIEKGFICRRLIIEEFRRISEDDEIIRPVTKGELKKIRREWRATTSRFEYDKLLKLILSESDYQLYFMEAARGSIKISENIISKYDMDRYKGSVVKKIHKPIDYSKTALYIAIKEREKEQEKVPFWMRPEENFKD